METQSQQTAVEWLIENMPEDCRYSLPSEFVAQALEIERHRHKETWLDSTKQFANDARMNYPIFFSDYYKQKYGL